MVGVKATDVGGHFCDPCTHNGARCDSEADLISIIAVRFICQLQCKKGRIILVGDTGDCVDACQQLLDVVLVSLHRQQDVLWYRLLRERLAQTNRTVGEIPRPVLSCNRYCQ